MLMVLMMMMQMMMTVCGTDQVNETMELGEDDEHHRYNSFGGMRGDSCELMLVMLI